MGFRFRRSVNIFPGLSLNFSGSGISVSIGPRGLRYTVGSKGTRVTAGLPGTGLSWTEYTPHQTERPSNFINNAHVQDERLQVIDSRAIQEVAALSSSELAPLLSKVQKRFRLAPIQLVMSLVVFILALLSGLQILIASAALLSVLFIPLFIYVDRYRRSVKVLYSIEGIGKKISDALAETFEELRGCAAVWNIAAQGRTSDWKRNAGAAKLSDRKRVRLKEGRPACIRSSAVFPAVRTATQELYFLPDALLLVKGNSVTAISYQEIRVFIEPVQFIESERIPNDTTVVRHTWEYVNKKGGPDRRFKANKQIPVCRYGELNFQSESGLNCIIQFSDFAKGEKFGKMITVLSNSGARLQLQTVMRVTSAKRWPLLIISTVSICLSVIISSLSMESVQFRQSESSIKAHSTSSSSAVPAPIINTQSATPLPPSKSPPLPASIEGRSRGVKAVPQIQNETSRSMKQCVAIIDVNERVECLEQLQTVNENAGTSH